MAKTLEQLVEEANKANLGSYDRMYKDAYRRTYLILARACNRAFKASEFAGDFWAATNGVEDAVENATRDWLKKQKGETQ
jgi:hypothetical protein